jgi:hypothetical protein
MFVEGRKHQVPQTWVIKPKNEGNWENITPREGTRADNVCPPKGPQFLPIFLAIGNSSQTISQQFSLFLSCILSFIRPARHKKTNQQQLFPTLLLFAQQDTRKPTNNNCFHFYLQAKIYKRAEQEQSI